MSKYNPGDERSTNALISPLDNMAKSGRLDDDGNFSATKRSTQDFLNSGEPTQKSSTSSSFFKMTAEFKDFDEKLA